MKTDETDTIKGNAENADNTATNNGNAAEDKNLSDADKEKDKSQEEIKKLLGSIESDDEQPLQATVTLTKILGGVSQCQGSAQAVGACGPHYVLHNSLRLQPIQLRQAALTNSQPQQGAGGSQIQGYVEH